MNEELRAYLGGLPAPAIDKILRYYELLVRGNELQNLTRLISPRDFYEGHVLDVLEFLKLTDLEPPFLDLGSGAGVPGLLAAILHPQPWVLVESEKRKAGFLEDCISQLSLNRVSVFAGRVEAFLQKNHASTIVTRAAGSILRIHSWIGNCSTWNKLVLFKGPRWDEEWKEFQPLRPSALKIISTHRYAIEEKQRQLVVLTK